MSRQIPNLRHDRHLFQAEIGRLRWLSGIPVDAV